MDEIGRRQLLRATAAALAATGLSGCAGLTRRVSATSSGSRDTLTFQTWAADAELVAFRRLVRDFEELHPKVTVRLQVVPYAEMFTGIDAGLQSGSAPDVFRVDYQTMGLYSGTGQLLDVTGALADSLVDDLRPALLRAVQHGGRTYGVPHHTDTTALLYRPDLLRRAGVRSVPRRLEDAWSWEEFGAIADRLHDALPDGVHAFGVNWQIAGAYRWLTWLFQAGGRLFDKGLDHAAIDSDAGRRALSFTRSFFERGWVPQNSSTKGASYPDVTFTSGKLGMVFAGNFLLPTLQASIGKRFDYRVTHQPQDRRSGTDLGGNALVANRRAANPDLAAAFLDYAGEARSMRDFCAETALLPSRRSVADGRIDYAVRPDLMPTFIDQLTTLRDEDVAQVTTSTFAEINTILQNDLEGCLIGGKSVEQTLRGLRDRVDETTVATR